MMPETSSPRASSDPTPRALEQLYREIKSLEEKFVIKFEGYDDAVRLLQEFANRQPTTEAVNENLKAARELTAAQFEALKELTNAKFDGNKTALDAALKTQKEASDKIETNFAKQFDNLSKNIDDLKDRINRNDGRATGLGTAGSIALGVASLIGVAVVVASFIIARSG